MVKGIDKLVAGPLALKGDELDAKRAEVIELLMTSSPDDLPLNDVYNMAHYLWEPIATDVYNNGNLNAENIKTLNDIFMICTWINTDAREHSQFHHGNAYIVGAIAGHFLGNSDVALEYLKVAMTMPVGSSGWVGAAETMMRVLVDTNQFDQAMSLVREVLQHVPDNAYANRLLEAYEIDLANEARAKATPSTPTATSSKDFSHVTMANYAEVAQQMAQQFQTQVTTLMSGPMDYQEKMILMQKMQAEYQADMQKLVSKISA